MADQALAKEVETILEFARWAPSGDNAQPWTFRIKGEREFEVLVRHQQSNVYEYRDGEPTLISAGALLENIQLAASSLGLAADWHYARTVDGIDHILVQFRSDDTASATALFGQITHRSVDRRPFRMRALTSEQKDSLSKALDPEIEVGWYDNLTDRCRIASLSARATIIRLTIPETFEIHGSIVDWKNRYSEYGIPSQALGLDRLTLQFTRWALAKWSRTKLANMFGAPYMASLQMDLVPGIFCASYFVVRLRRRAKERGDALAQILKAGQAIQRFWLQATALGLAIQPCVAMLAFWSYSASGQEFTVLKKARTAAQRLARSAETVFGENDDIIFLGRIGWPRNETRSRSTRLPLIRLIER